jgi:hypothetical protein
MEAVPVTGGLILELVEDAEQAPATGAPRTKRSGWHPLDTRAPGRSEESTATAAERRKSTPRKRPAKRRRQPRKPRA